MAIMMKVQAVMQIEALRSMDGIALTTTSSILTSLTLVLNNAMTVTSPLVKAEMMVMISH